MTAGGRTLWRNLLLVFVSLAVSLAIAEAALRFLSMGYMDHPTNGHPVLHHVQPPNFEFDNFDVAGEFGGNSVIYDENGLRIPRHGFEFDSSRPDAVFLGDSFVEASELPYEDTFIAKFGADFERFNARNFGVSSYSPLLSYLQLKHFLPSLDPALIVHLVFDNDLENDENYFERAEMENGEVTAVPGRPNDVVRDLVRESYIARLLNRAWFTARALMRSSPDGGDDLSSYYLDDPDLGEITPRYIGKIAELAREEGVRYLLMCVPSKLKFNEKMEHRDLCEKIKEFATASGLEYVDLDEYFSRHANGRKPFYDRNIHLNDVGHRLAYGALLEYLEAHPLKAR